MGKTVFSSCLTVVSPSSMQNGIRVKGSLCDSIHVSSNFLVVYIIHVTSNGFGPCVARFSHLRLNWCQAAIVLSQSMSQERHPLKLRSCPDSMGTTQNAADCFDRRPAPTEATSTPARHAPVLDLDILKTNSPPHLFPTVGFASSSASTSLPMEQQVP